MRRGRTLHLQLLVQGLDIVLDVLTDGAADVRPHEQRVEPERGGGGGGEGQEEEEPGEDAEHLVGVLGGAELVPEPRRDPGLHAVDALIVPGREEGEEGEEEEEEEGEENKKKQTQEKEEDDGGGRG